MDSASELIPQGTEDGTLTFFSPIFCESFHSHSGAYQEAVGKFVQPTQLRQKAQEPELAILDICYGLGYNSAAALEAVWQINPACHIHLIALELNPAVPKAAIAHHCLQDFSPAVQTCLSNLATTHQVNTDTLTARLYIGDARQRLPALPEQNFLAAAIFLDPFSPPRCPQLWTVEFLALVSHCLDPQGILATYSCAAAVRSGLMMGGLQVGSSPPIGRRSPGTVAAYIPTELPPLSQQETEHLHTQAAIPYRDPTLRDNAQTILARRQQEQQQSKLEPTKAWKKRWFLDLDLVKPD
ncbi:MAG: hypothetical protein HC934_09315 [Acaryochloridaceae cyanobacterium SU_2_1]|nr:hypothetical protein [Acaryochloridaceae cyanobacterium SU_2_1]